MMIALKFSLTSSVAAIARFGAVRHNVATHRPSTIFVSFQKRLFNTHETLCQAEKQQKSSSDIDVQRERPYEHLSMGQKGYILQTIMKELLSSSGPNAVYSEAAKKCKNSVEVLDTLGAPVKAYGEGHRRQHVPHETFQTSNGEEHTRIVFHLQGQFRKALVRAEAFKNDKGEREFEYLIVECEGYPPKTIRLEQRKTPKPSETITFY